MLREEKKKNYLLASSGNLTFLSKEDALFFLLKKANCRNQTIGPIPPWEFTEELQPPSIHIYIYIDMLKNAGISKWVDDAQVKKRKGI